MLRSLDSILIGMWFHSEFPDALGSPYNARAESMFAIERRSFTDRESEVLVLYLKRPTREDLSFRCAVKGRFRYSDLKEAAPGDYGICIWMSRS